MSFSLKKVPDQPLVLFVANEGYSITGELMESIQAAERIISAQREPVYYVQDLRAVVVENMDEFIMGSNLLSRGDSPLYHHPKIKKVICITTDDLLIAAFEGMGSALFGGTEIVVFDTLDEALDFVAAGG